MKPNGWNYDCSAVELASGQFVARLVISPVGTPARKQVRGFAKQFDAEADAIAYAEAHADRLRGLAAEPPVVGDDAGKGPSMTSRDHADTGIRERSPD